MLYAFLTIAIIFLAAVASYIFYFGPKMDPNNRAEEFIRSNNISEAILEYKKILDENPYDFVTNFRISNLYMKIGKIDQAALHLEKIIDINKYNYEVDKLTVQKSLAKIYLRRDEVEKAFMIYADVVTIYPGDIEALYNTAFMCLGQEEFELAQRYFDRLYKLKSNEFDIAFGAGICNYQNQKINESVDLFKAAVQLRGDSEIANLALMFAYWRKRDYRKALGFVEKLLKLTSEQQTIFAAKRAMAFLYLFLKKQNTAVTKFEELLGFAKSNELIEEMYLVLYDLGFACLADEQTKKAYNYWNELDEQKKDYKGVSNLVISLRMEMDNQEEEFSESVYSKIDKWKKEAFPVNFLWNICGLKSKKTFDVRSYVVTTNVSSESSQESYQQEPISSAGADMIQTYLKLDSETFRIISNRALEKMGYKVDQILNTYKDVDGVDFMAKNKETGDTTFVGVRRWSKTKVGEIPLRNFAQQVNDMKARKGLFVTTADLTEGAYKTAENLSKVKVVTAEELNNFLQGLM